jgi:hypothetical protein
VEDQTITVNGKEEDLWGECCWTVEKTPENVQKCLRNPDSYMQFILGIFMLAQGYEAVGEYWKYFFSSAEESDDAGKEEPEKENEDAGEELSDDSSHEM